MSSAGEPSSPPSSFELIDQAFEAGRIDAETALIYKVFAQFSDARLPAEFVGGGTMRGGDLIMEQVAVQSASLSPAAVQTLIPFFVPPDHPGSWYSLQRMGASAALDDPPGWSSVVTGNGKVKISWPTGNADGARQAVLVKGEMDAKIWNNLVDLMGAAPLPDPSAGGMLRIYLWNSYVENDGTVVAFDPNILGITVGSSCDQTPVVIYMPLGLPDGSENSEGLIQYVTHEFMHAIQFGMKIENCGSYLWLKEATATWAEDFIYSNANSEWGTAPKFMQHAQKRLDTVGGMHEYGAYLLPYFLTKQFGDDAVIRKMWENAAGQDNSYLAVKESLPDGMRDYFWPLFLSALWNKAPFQEFYKDKDRLLESVKPENAAPVQVSAMGKEFIYEIKGDLPTGAARFYQVSFLDQSVSSFSILNGLGYKLSKGAAEEGETVDGDQTYVWSDLSPQEAEGALVMALVKIAGHDWRPMIVPNNQYSHCVDAQGKIESLVIVQSNADFEHPERVMQPADLPTTIHANNMPCWKVTGTSSITMYNHGVTRTVSASNIVYKSVFDVEALDPYLDLPWVFPVNPLMLKSATVNWSIGGSNEVCSYSGSGTFEVHEHPGAGSDSVVLYNGILAGSPTYRGYSGAGDPDEGTEVTYEVQCDDDPPYTDTEPAWRFLEIPIWEQRVNIKVSGDGGTLSGTYRHTEPWGDWTEYQWNLVRQKK